MDDPGIPGILAGFPGKPPPRRHPLLRHLTLSGSSIPVEYPNCRNLPDPASQIMSICRVFGRSRVLHELPPRPAAAGVAAAPCQPLRNRSVRSSLSPPPPTPCEIERSPVVLKRVSGTRGRNHFSLSLSPVWDGRSVGRNCKFSRLALSVSPHTDITRTFARTCMHSSHSAAAVATARGRWRCPPSADGAFRNMASDFSNPVLADNPLEYVNTTHDAIVIALTY